MKLLVHTALFIGLLLSASIVRGAGAADSSALEKAVAGFSLFLHNKPYGNDYFNGIQQKGNILKIKFLKKYYDFMLDKIEKVVLTKEEGRYVVTVSASRDCYYDSGFEQYYKSETFSKLSEKDCMRFYLLFGNILDQYRLATNKKYKIRKTYAEKLAILTAPGFRTVIPSGAVVQVLEINKSEPAYKSLKKLTGTEIQVYGLTVNEDAETYSGSIRKDAINSFTVSAIRVKYLYGTPNSVFRIAPAGDFCTKAGFMIRKMADNELKSLIPYTNPDKYGLNHLISDVYFEELPDGSFAQKSPDMIGFFKQDMREEEANELFKRIGQQLKDCLGLNPEKRNDKSDLKNFYYRIPAKPGDQKKVMLLFLFDKNIRTGYYQVRLDFANY